VYSVSFELLAIFVVYIFIMYQKSNLKFYTVTTMLVSFQLDPRLNFPVRRYLFILIQYIFCVQFI